MGKPNFFLFNGFNTKMTERDQVRLLGGFVLGTVFSGVCSALAWYSGANHT
jgi:hypothetical protein